ncbi:MAG: hypothetical protein GWO41_13080 [candidate division Zixibacteria bacterium]|nr:hypothetical protein [candidate division Zixibacteria bacterium]NIR67904.1 hypothetical protein [candidate division Zixibacteria bacterium]NIS17285.1 hypothetical protein [candidate division Zixibacteria bacterium]NIS49121.1 hypothetical protein [candidate division Zixibacteria bacterium]NIT53633.1 hypothetical protein [candidate division Zixibacteria bacterium]
MAEKTGIRRGSRYTTIAIYGLVAVVFYGAIPRLYDIWNLQPGEVTGLLTMAATAVLSLIILCLFSGALFVGIVQTVSAYSRITSLSFVYVVESLGSLAGGVLLTFICLTLIPDRYTALLLFLLIVAIMFIKMDKKLLLMPPRVTVGVMCVFAGVAFALGQFGNQFENQEVVAQTNTAYQHLTLTEYESQYTLYSDGLSFFSYPQVQEAEEIHLTLWQKADVKNIAMIGICPPDKIAEILKYENARVNIFENDKILLDFLVRYLPEPAGQSYMNPAVSYDWGDPYINITDDGEDYDFVIINISNPTDAVGNRYFTVDFFERLSSHLQDDCVLSFSLPGSAHLIGRDLQEFLGTIYNALRTRFENIKIIPGDDYIFLASNDSAMIGLDTDVLLKCKEQNGISTTFVDSVYLSYRLDEFNLLKANQIYNNELSAVNTVSRPVVYYYNSILWASRFSGLEESILKFWKENKYLIYILLFLPLISLLNLLKRSVLRPAYFSICFLAGFSGITLEMSLLILYQSHLGNVYSQIGLLIGLFMVGMALGGALPLRSKGTTIFMKKWFYLGAIIGVFVLFGLAIINRLEGHHFFKYLLILGLSFLSGGFSGYLFNYAAVSYKHKYGTEAPGRFYLADLLGASLAGIFISILFIPLIGFGSVLALFFVLYLVYVILHRFVIIGV